MTNVSKGEFIEIEYTGRLKDENIIFDTTDEKIAKENNLEGSDYSPVVMCVGEGQVLSGIDKNLEGKEIGKEYDIIIKPEDGFGSKNAKLIQLIPTNKFKQQNIQPMPGLQINIDGMVGLVKTVSGGRILVDFNHPLSGKNLLYKVKINRKVTDDKEKLSGFVRLSFGTKDFEIEINEGNAKITLKTEVPKQAEEKLNEDIIKLIPSIKKVEFVLKKNK